MLKIVNTLIFDRYYYISLLFLILITVILAVLLQKHPGGEGHDGYLELAQSIASGKGYTVHNEIITGRSPLYPYLLSIGLFFGFSYYWVWILNFLFCFLSSALLKNIIDKYKINTSGLISILIACNPSMLWLCTNSMPYAAALFLITLIIFCFVYQKYIYSISFSLLLFFLHPSFGIISILLILSSLYFASNKVKSLIVILFAVIIIFCFNIEIKKNYGGFPVFSATGAGFQYLRARNQYLTGKFNDDLIFKASRVKRTANDVVFSCVTNNRNTAKTVDDAGKKILANDLFNPMFLIPKCLIGIKNTVISGLMPDILILPIYIYLIFFLLRSGDSVTIIQEPPDKVIVFFLCIILLFQIAILSIVGFKMRYSAYFLPLYPFFIMLYFAFKSLFCNKKTIANEK
jgi:hypothetical protein